MMRMFAWIGRNGPVILFFGALAGLAFPWLASAAKPFMAQSVCLFTFGVFAKASLREFRASSRHPLATLGSLAGCVFLVPFAAALVAHMLNLPADMCVGVVLAAAAPPSAAAIAAMLGLDVSLAAVTMAITAVLAPLTLPWLVRSLGFSVPIDSWALAARLAWLVAPPALAACALKITANGWARSNGQALTGVASLGLVLVALGAMDGIQRMALDNPGRAAGFLAFAFAMNIALQAFGALLSRGLCKVDALTMGLSFGNRNITLVWVAAAPFLAGRPDAELFMAMSILPIFTIPVFQRMWMRASAQAALEIEAGLAAASLPSDPHVEAPASVGLADLALVPGSASQSEPGEASLR